MDDLVIEAYRRLGSVTAVAQYLGVSVVKVRRILITAGLWRSERSDAILDLLHEGFSSDEIATKLNVTRKAVEAYMPYTQGSYGGFERSYHSRGRISEATVLHLGNAQKKPDGHVFVRFFYLYGSVKKV